MTDQDMDMSMNFAGYAAGGESEQRNKLHRALTTAQAPRPNNKGRRLSLMEELSIKKLTPGTSKKKEKEADKKLGMNTLMAQIAERRKALTEEGNILRKDKAIDESIMEHPSSEDSFD
jgi:hypothetical protein